MISQGKSTACVGLGELQAYARIETGEEEALLAGLLRSATEICETFLNQALLSRTFEQELTAREGWTRLAIQPVRSIHAVFDGGSAEALPATLYLVDIDHDGRAYLKGLQPGRRYRVAGSAGIGVDANQVPEPIRQGIVRLASHLYSNRDHAGGELPGAVTALWRPYRRASLVA